MLQALGTQLKNKAQRGNYLRDALDVQIVYFTLDEINFGLNMNIIGQIVYANEMGPPPLTAPSFVVGTYILRGHVLPVIDLAIRLHLSVNAHLDLSINFAELDEVENVRRIVLLRCQKGVRGLLIDDLSHINLVQKNDIQPLPPLTVTNGADFYTGIVEIEDRYVLLLDPDKI